MKTHLNQLRSPRFYSLFLGALPVNSLTLGAAFGAVKTWDGGGGDNLWKTGVNWNANTAPVAGDVLTFTNTPRLDNANDFAAGTGFGGINFLSSAGAFSLGGNAISLDGNITNNQPVISGGSFGLNKIGGWTRNEPKI